MKNLLDFKKREPLDAKCSANLRHDFFKGKKTLNFKDQEKILQTFIKRSGLPTEGKKTLPYIEYFFPFYFIITIIF